MPIRPEPVDGADQGPRLAVDLDRAAEHVAVLVVRERRHRASPGTGAGRGPVEPLRPRAAQRGALLLGAEPARGANPTSASALRRRRGSARSPARSSRRTGRAARRSRPAGRRRRPWRPRRRAVGRGAQEPAVLRRRSATRGRRTRRRRGSRRAASASRAAAARAATRRRARARAGEHAEQQVEVVGAARDRAEHVDVGVGRAAADVVEVAALRDHAEARLEPEHAAAVRRDAHRAADVGAELEAGEAGRDRGGRAARRAARPCDRGPTGCSSCRRSRCRSGGRPTSAARWSCRTRSRPRP